MIRHVTTGLLRSAHLHGVGLAWVEDAASRRLEWLEWLKSLGGWWPTVPNIAPHAPDTERADYSESFWNNACATPWLR